MMHHETRSVARLALVCASAGVLVACGGGSAPPAPVMDGGVARDAGGAIDAARGADAGRGADGGGAIDGGGDGVDAGAADAGASLCPPTPPFGRAPGETIGELVLRDCDGVEHSLHELCDRQAVWLFEFADWCPPCRSFASSDANRIYRAFSSESFAAWMVISEDAGFAAPDAADCAAIRDRYGIEMPVLIDPTGALQSLLGVAPNEVHVVLGEGARIDWVGHYAGSMVESRIRATLAR